MRNELTIRIVTQQDLPSLVNFARFTFKSTYEQLNNPEDFQTYLAHAFTVEQFQTEWEQHNSHFFVAMDTNELVGYIKLNFNKAENGLDPSESVELERIYVHPACKGQGIGSQLLKKSIQFSRSQQKSVLWLGVWERNPAAIGFYEQKGFKRFGTHIFTIGSDAQTDFLMKLSL